MWEKLANASKLQYAITQDHYYLFLLDQIAKQVKPIEDKDFHRNLIDYLMEMYQQVEDEVGLISCLITLNETKSISKENSKLLMSLLKKTEYACFNEYKEKMGIIFKNQNKVLVNKLLEKLNQLG